VLGALSIVRPERGGFDGAALHFLSER